jgi:hypothetical protein
VDGDPEATGGSEHKNLRERHNSADMQAANWRHLHYFPFNQLYSGMPGEHTSFRHPVKFRDIEKLSMCAIRILRNRGRLSDIVHPWGGRPADVKVHAKDSRSRLFSTTLD